MGVSFETDSVLYERLKCGVCERYHWNLQRWTRTHTENSECVYCEGTGVQAQSATGLYGERQKGCPGPLPVVPDPFLERKVQNDRVFRVQHFLRVSELQLLELCV